MAEIIVSPSPEQIKAWKQEFGRVYVCNFPARFKDVKNPAFNPKKKPDPKTNPEFIPEQIAGPKKCFLRKPDRKILKYAQLALKKSGLELDFNEALLTNCFIGGDPEVKTDDDYIMGAGNFIGGIIDIAFGELEEL